MSGNEPAAPQRRELEIMRVLFERRLKDRAIALADSRWPGSGKMVDLAYEWGQLDPGERRDRLSAIGPEEIARLREFAELNPDLSQAVTELDRRGVLPHIEAAAIDIAAATREQNQPSEPSRTTPQAAVETQPAREESRTASQPDAAEAESNEPAVPSIEEAQAQLEALQNKQLNVDMPELDLGLPSTSEFLTDEQKRRDQASQSAQDAMDRVRKSLDRSTQRAFDRSSSIGTTSFPDLPRPAMPSVASFSTSSDDELRSAPKAIDAPATLARWLETHVVATVGASDARPSDDQLVALANDMQLGYSEHSVEIGNRREAFGGLVSEYGQIVVKAGSVSAAVAEPNLVVIHGRLWPNMTERLEEGFLDIPGTRASVRVHPKARVVVLGDR